MSQKRSQRFKLLLDLAERKRKEADRMLGEAQQRVVQAKQSIEQLKNYQVEYRNQFIEQGKQGVDAGQIAVYQGFLGRLTHASEQSHDALKQSQMQLEKIEQHWREAYAHFKAMEKLYEKALKDEQKVADKQVQKQLDEFSQRMHKPFD